MEQALINEGISVSEIKRLCDAHTEVFSESLTEQPKNETVPGHPVQTFKKENRALEDIINNKVRPSLKALENGNITDEIPRLRISLSYLNNVEQHYKRKENLLFPYLEKNGFNGPTQVMWGIHDDIRMKFKDINKSISGISVNSETHTEPITGSVDELLGMIESMIYKEENILFPTSLELLTEDEWGEIMYQSPEIGFCLIEPDNLWKPGRPEPIAQRQNEISSTPQGFLKFETGILTPEEVSIILNTLPLDVTFIDKNDIVKYFSQGSERIFLRSKSIIGRKVQNCHPPSSVNVVEKVLEDLKSGKKNHEDFWINFQGKYAYIRYFAVRSPEGEYIGTLEVTQNIKPLQEIQGEKRLAQPEITH